MTTTPRDAALVAGHLAGDASALAGIYDRYADPLHDTAAAMLNDRDAAADVLHDVILIAAERLDQLRDPERLKPWLFAILRNEVYRRTKQRRRTIATDFSGSDDGHDMADEQAVDPSTRATDDAAGEDLAELVRNAARGLDDRDQLVLELSVRQGLGGQDLADALGVTAKQSYTLVHRMRERVERSLTAYVVAKAGRRDCDDLDAMLASWDGEFTVLVRKRVARHVDACEVCDTRRRKVAALAMFAAAPVYAAPAALRDRILHGTLQTQPPVTPYRFTAADGFPRVVRTARRAATWVAPTAAASLILVAAGLGVALVDRGDDDTVRDEAFVSVATDLSTTASPERSPSTVAPSGTSGASNDSVPAITTAAPITVADDSPPAAETPGPEPEPGTSVRPTTTSPAAPPAAPPTTSPATPPPPPASPTAPPDDATPPAAPPSEPPSTPRSTPQAAPPAAPATPTSAAPVDPGPTTPPAPAPAPGQLSVDASSVALGSGAASGSVGLTNLGELPVTYSVGGNSGPFSVSPPSGTLNGGESTSVTASIDRSDLAEGSGPGGTITISGDDGSSFPVSLSAEVERSPTISGGQPSVGCNSTDVTFFSPASVSDESGVSNASWSMAGPFGQSGSIGLNGNNGFNGQSFSYGPNFDPTTVNGTWTWSISATDTRGNVASASGSFNVAC